MTRGSTRPRPAARSSQTWGSSTIGSAFGIPDRSSLQKLVIEREIEDRVLRSSEDQPGRRRTGGDQADQGLAPLGDLQRLTRRGDAVHEPEAGRLELWGCGIFSLHHMF